MQENKRKNLKSILSRLLRLLFPLFIGTGFTPYYRVIDPIARGKYALSIMLLGQVTCAITANLLCIKKGSVLEQMERGAKNLEKCS